MEERGIRDQIVVATKACPLFSSISTRLSDWIPLQYTSSWKKMDDNVKQKVHFVGNNLKSLHHSVEASLKKLRTDFIDLLYIHWWDHETSVEEVMNGLHNLVVQGKVLYLVSFIFIPSSGHLILDRVFRIPLLG